MRILNIVCISKTSKSCNFYNQKTTAVALTISMAIISIVYVFKAAIRSEIRENSESTKKATCKASDFFSLVFGDARFAA